MYIPENHPDLTKDPDSVADKKTGSPREVATENNDFIRCRKCRFIFDRRLVAKGSYDGLSYESFSGTNLKEPVVNSGCPFCGTYEYD